ncbi:MULTISPECIES: TonB-dependent receptor [Empedobacter]|uniref:TonB-dependent receptor n=1 Tax=Empedobacter falsenii TaxID=343874 RepID=A0A7H9DUB9_9FLAO|nr:MULTISPECIES: TonB-dependent receptor [Empedobacter]MDH2208457.1 TonB-dependent receptor [Empedobacter sp. GD03644]QLL58341.1 TonB-dependent receptor [Empedobacter falsenii]
MRKKYYSLKTVGKAFLLVLMVNQVDAKVTNLNEIYWENTINYDQETGEIHGYVVTEDGSPIADAYVSLSNGMKTKTSSDGTFVFTDIEKGTYELTINHFNYNEIIQDVTITDQTNATLSIVLKTDNQLKEVVVTASRMPESIDEVPSTLTYISAKDMQIQSQINDNLPNILMQKVPSISPSEESQNNFIGKIRGRNFLVLIDGIPQSTPLRNGGRDLRSIDASAIDHIEVIQGASSMYGNGAAGGIVNYITKKANNKKKINSSTYFNNTLSLVNPKETFGYNISQVFSGKLDKFTYLLQGKIANTGVVRSADGEINSPFYGIGETKSYNALLKIGYQISDNHHIELMGNYYRSMQDSKYEGTKGIFGESPSIAVLTDNPANGGTPYSKNVSLRYDGEFGKTSANAVLYYEDMNSVFETYNQIYSDHKGARLNFTTPFELGKAGKVTLIYGVDFLKDHAVQLGLDKSHVTPDMDLNSFAYYIQSKFNLAERWIVKAGIRHEFLGFKVGDLTKANKFTPGDKNNSNALVFNIAARYNKLSYLQPFVSFSQGYSIGDIGLVLRNNVALDAIDPKPVSVNNYEAGISGNFWKLDYQLTGYYSTSDRGTTFAEIGAPGNYQLSQVPQRIYGLEAVVNVKPIKWLKVGGIMGYMDGRQDLKNEGEFKDKLDNSILTPLKLSFNLDTKITDQWNVFFQLTNLSGRDVFDKSQYNYGKYPISGYTICDLYTSYKLKNITFNLSFNNLFNADYYPIHAEVRGATNDGRYYIKGSGTTASLGLKLDL